MNQPSRLLNAMLPTFDFWQTSMATVDVALASVSSQQALAALRTRRLTALLAASRRSPLYQRIIGQSDPASLRLEDLPAMRKAELMSNFKAWVTEPELDLDEMRCFIADPSLVGTPFRGRFLVWESSGSHGEPGIFVQDSAAMAVYDALEAMRRRVPSPGRMAFVGATGGHFASTLSVERLRRLNPVLAHKLHSVSFLQPLAELADELQSIDPQSIATYPSVAVLLAQERMAGRLAVHPRQIWTGGETLTDGMRELIALAFGCEVINSYGASEFMPLAFECRHRQLHLNSDWAILEPVDDHDQPVPLGQAGSSTLLTNLANHVQPIIRYDLGDRVTIHAEPCACGSRLPVIEVHGRSGALMHLGQPGRKGVDVSMLAVSTVLESVEGLPDFQLIQIAPDELNLHTALGGPAIEAALRRASSALTHYLSSQGLPHVRIHGRTHQPNRLTRNGKVLRIMAMPNPR